MGWLYNHFTKKAFFSEDWKTKEIQIAKNKAEANIRNFPLSQQDTDILNKDWVNGNHHFISKNPKSLQAQRLEKVISKLPAYKGSIYRGSEQNPLRHDYKVGKEFSFGHLGAWSKDPNVAEMHATKHNSPIIYKVDNQYYGKDISCYVNSDKKAESEILTSSSAKYIIKRKRKVSISNLEGNNIVALLIEMEEII